MSNTTLEESILSSICERIIREYSEFHPDPHPGDLRGVRYVPSPHGTISFTEDSVLYVEALVPSEGPPSVWMPDINGEFAWVSVNQDAYDAWVDKIRHQYVYEIRKAVEDAS